jgi:ATP-dependent DNA helicase RecG
LGRGGELGAPAESTAITLLTGSLPAKARKLALLTIASGQAGIVVGTHALLSEGVFFANLGLIVVDEQHRFGVEQRHALRTKHPDGSPPHVLVMTATPIPRTVAMTVFGDLDTSSLDELPRGRSPIGTTVVPAAEKPAWVERAWQRIREEVGKGHQAYVVCPKIGDGSGEDAAGELFEDGSVAETDSDAEGESARRAPLAVTQVAAMLRDGPLADLRVGVLHGRLVPAEKDAVMIAFAAGELDVLVATTVIEVGVDVPNATMMVIMDAERFGMSQLHQLRGRVGRGSAPGICLLVTELRREGNVLGTEQAGKSTALRQLSLLRDRDVIEHARTDAAGLVGDDPAMARWPGLADMVSAVIAEQDQDYLDKG